MQYEGVESGGLSRTARRVGLVPLCVGLGLALGVPSASRAQFTTEASVSYSMTGRTYVGGPTDQYGDAQSLSTQSPFTEPARLEGSIGGVTGGEAASASLFANASLLASAGLLRARIDGSTSVTWSAASSVTQAFLTSATAQVRWRDGYFVTGTPGLPQPGRLLTVVAVLELTGSLTSQIVPPPQFVSTANGATVVLQLFVTGRDGFGQDVLQTVPPYAGGAFGIEARSTALGFVYQPRPAPLAIPIQFQVSEQQVSFLEFAMELRATASSASNVNSSPDIWATGTTFDANFGSTLRWGGISSVVDASTGEVLEGWSVTSTSGVDYARPVPEPTIGATSLATLLAVLALRARAR